MSESPSRKVSETRGSPTKAQVLAPIQVFQEKIEQLERTDANLKKLASRQKVWIRIGSITSFVRFFFQNWNVYLRKTCTIVLFKVLPI